MRKATIAVALLGLLAGTVQAKSYEMVGWWQEDRRGSPPTLAAAAAVDGDATKSNLLFVLALSTAVTGSSDPAWMHQTPYSVVSGLVSILTDTGPIMFTGSTGTNLSNPLDGGAPYHPDEFLFTADITEVGATGTALTGTVTATWSNDLAELQTFGGTDEIYGVGPEFDQATGTFPEPGDYGLFVTVDIPDIPEDTIIPEPLTVLAAGAGLMGLGGYIRRRRRD